MDARRGAIRSIAIAALAATASCGPSPDLAPAIGTRIPFRISSAGSGYLITGQVSGTVTVQAESVVVDVEQLRWTRVSDHVVPPSAVLGQLTILSGLAYLPGGGRKQWWHDSLSTKVPLRDSVVGPDSGVAGPFRLAIARSKARSLSHEWVFFRFDYSLPLKPRGIRPWEESNICTRRDLFRPPYADTSSSMSVGPEYPKTC